MCSFIDLNDLSNCFLPCLLFFAVFTLFLSNFPFLLQQRRSMCVRRGHELEHRRNRRSFDGQALQPRHMFNMFNICSPFVLFQLLSFQFTIARRLSPCSTCMYLAKRVCTYNFINRLGLYALKHLER
ncbi:hypothetical protein BS78_03G109200 [Paspalum vaginatum]|nr:hypothetical protein BS78_03G109200 [Paspalum vaginatum]